MDFMNLWQAWPIAGPWQLTEMSGGKNNRVWRADMIDGQSYVLRFIPDAAQVPRVRYEAALLKILSQQQPPFLLPCPLPARDGDATVFVKQKMKVVGCSTLSPLLPGNIPRDWDDLALASSAGYALAWLDHALATLPEIPLSEGVQSSPLFGALADWHPNVPDPLAAVERLPIEQEDAQRLRRLLATVLEKVPDLYRRLPQQLLHRDYDPGNILMDQRRVTAVCDFEFAGTDLRVLDLCVALSWWPVDFIGTGKEWEIINAFGKSYISSFPLGQDELLAIPDVWQLRDATSLVYRMGRYLAGTETDESMQKRVQHSLWREAWLSDYRETFVQHIMSWDR